MFRNRDGNWIKTRAGTASQNDALHSLDSVRYRHSRRQSRALHQAAEALAAIDTSEERLPPIAAGKIPAHGPSQPGLETLERCPPQLSPDAGCIDCVPQVVTGPIGNKGDQVFTRPSSPGLHRVHELADRSHHVDIPLLLVAADQIC